MYIYTNIHIRTVTRLIHVCKRNSHAALHRCVSLPSSWLRKTLLWFCATGLCHVFLWKRAQCKLSDFFLERSPMKIGLSFAKEKWRHGCARLYSGSVRQVFVSVCLPPPPLPSLSTLSLSLSLLWSYETDLCLSLSLSVSLCLAFSFSPSPPSLSFLFINSS